MSGLSLTAATVPDLIADINSANAAGGANTITLTAKTTSPYVLTRVNNSTYGTTGPGLLDSNGLPIIAANDNLTIVGNGDTIERGTLSVYSTFRLFAVAGGASLTLQNLKLQYGGGDTNGVAENGGAIFNQGTLDLNGVTVQGSSAIFGGGIYSDYNSVTLLEGGTIVQKNSAFAYSAGLYSAGSPGCGGGLYCNGAMLTVTNSTLDNNYAGSGDGGALYVNGGNVSLSNDTIESNKAAVGGGLFVNGSGSAGPATVTLSYDTVESNTASIGAGLYVAGGDVTLSYDTVVSNAANQRIVNNGGGLYVAGGNVTLSNDTLESNKATSGGGLYVAGGNVTLTNDTVESNTATSDGGGLYVFRGGAATLSNDTFESNTASAYGGGIYIYPASTVDLDSFSVTNTINNTDESGLNGITANIDGTYILQNP
jgi:hypothetical protein